jgi:tRNA G18 (ribose-2'-O)-methylase SpoU
MRDRDERPSLDLIADGVSDPRNVPALLALAEVLGCRCLFRDRHELRGQLEDASLAARMIDAPLLEHFSEHYDLLLAIENHENARSIYEYHPPRGKRLAMVVGNEKKGLDRKVSRLADVMLEIPMRKRPGISLNVASAAAAATYQLLFANAPKRHKRGHGRERPDLLFWAPRDAADLGTSLRTAYALGWDSVWVMDSHRVWFDADRATTAQGRGAARRHKTSIRVRLFDPQKPAATFDTVLLLAVGIAGAPVWRLSLPERGSCAVVFADVPLTLETLDGFAGEVRPISLTGGADAPSDAALRLFSAITLTELNRNYR